jgi:hypothetical protein
MQFGEISALEGDMRTQDLVYVANGGRGMFYGYGPGSGIVRPGLRQGRNQDGSSTKVYSARFWRGYNGYCNVL